MSKPVIVLDPGHGGYDPGASYNGIKEKDVNLVLALKVADRLEGVKVLLTRERDTYVSLSDRVALSRRAEPDLFLSLHANAGGGRGFESFIYSGLGAKDPAMNKQQAVHSSVMAALARWEIVDRGMKRAAFYVLKYNSCPAVLIESLFLDNAREAKIWREPIFADTLAAAIALGVQEAVGVGGGTAISPQPFESDNTDSTPTPPLPPVEALYSVQVGAFAFLDNARQRLAEAQAAGFKDAYIYQKQV